MDYSVIVVSWMTIVLAGKKAIATMLDNLVFMLGPLIEVDGATLTPNLGELCPGQDVVLTCSTSEGTMEWLYNGVEISGSTFAVSLDPVGDSRSLQASGFMFSAELISIRPPVFATTLSFSADAAMKGDSVSCRAGGQTSTQTIQVVQRGKRSACPCIHVYIHEQFACALQ